MTTAHTTERLTRTARWLAYATIVWNALEAVVAITAGARAGSSALVGFGLDSIVEVGSAVVVVWQFRDSGHEDRERRALNLIGLSFFVFAAYIVADAALTLWHREAPDSSPVGIGLALASLIVMPALAYAKRRTARALGSRTVAADSAQTMLCTYLSAALLAGLVANALAGWWWADPLAALVIAAVAINEGREARLADRAEEACCR